MQGFSVKRESNFPEFAEPGIKSRKIRIIDIESLINFLKGVSALKITNITLRKITGQERLKAIATVTLDDLLVIHDIKIIQGQDKLFAAMPSKKLTDGRFADIVHPIDDALRKEMEEAIRRAYQEGETRF